MAYPRKKYKINDLKAMSQCSAISSEKKLWEKLVKNPLHNAILSVGDSFHYIIDFRNFSIPYISESAEGITGYDVKQWTKDGFDHNFKILHPDDGKIMKIIHQSHFDHNAKIPKKDKSKYRYTFDFRLKHADGHYIRLLHSSVFLLFDKNGKPLFNFCISTDISHTKKTKEMSNIVAKFNPLTNSYIFIESKTYHRNNDLHLTQRQAQILSLLANGKNNHQIGEILSITENTVKDQRKKMLKQNHINSTPELVKKAILNGAI